MATVSFLAGNEASSSNTVSVSVTPTTGRLLVCAVMIHNAFNAPTISSVTWNGNALTSAITRDGAGGGETNWEGAGIFYYAVASGTTANVVVTLSGSATRVWAAVYEIDSYNTGSPVGDTDFAELIFQSAHTLTLTTAANDVVIDCLVTQMTTDRWFQVQSGTTSGYNNDPRPGNNGIYKAASGYLTASGSSSAIGWDSKAFDASPIPEPKDVLHVAAVFQTAGGGAASIVPLLHHMQRMRTR